MNQWTPTQNARQGKEHPEERQADKVNEAGRGNLTPAPANLDFDYFLLMGNVLKGFGSEFLKKEEEYDFVCGC